MVASLLAFLRVDVRGGGARSAMAGEEVHFSTNAGDFSVELYPSYAPRTCKNFSELCARALRPAACRLCPAATVFTE